MIKDIRADIKSFAELVPISVTVTNILTSELKGKAANEKLISHVESDSALTAIVLRAANSSFFGFHGQVITVAHAVILIGYREISRIVLMHELKQGLININNEQRDYINRLWLHSITTATIARMLTNVIRYRSNGEEFTAGLLHDLGKFVLVQKYPQSISLVHTLITTNKATDIDAEKETLNMAHDEVGGILGKSWGLPTMLIETMREHHGADNAQNYPLVVALVRFADLLSERWGYGIEEQSNGYSVENDVCWKILQKNYQVFKNKTVAAVEETLRPDFESHKEFRELFL